MNLNGMAKIRLEVWGGLPRDAKLVVIEHALGQAANWRPNFPGVVRDNLHVLDAVVLEVRRLLRRGRTHYSMRTIIEVLRHNSLIADTSENFKLNNCLAPDLARLLMLMFPAELDGFFEVRNGIARIGRRAA